MTLATPRRRLLKAAPLALLLVTVPGARSGGLWTTVGDAFTDMKDEASDRFVEAGQRIQTGASNAWDTVVREVEYIPAYSSVPGEVWDRATDRDHWRNVGRAGTSTANDLWNTTRGELEQFPGTLRALPGTLQSTFGSGEAASSLRGATDRFYDSATLGILRTDLGPHRSDRANLGAYEGGSTVGDFAVDEMFNAATGRAGAGFVKRLPTNWQRGLDIYDDSAIRRIHDRSKKWNGRIQKSGFGDNLENERREGTRTRSSSESLPFSDTGVPSDPWNVVPTGIRRTHGGMYPREPVF